MIEWWFDEKIKQIMICLQLLPLLNCSRTVFPINRPHTPNWLDMDGIGWEVEEVWRFWLACGGHCRLEAVSVTPTTYEFYCAGLIWYYQLSSCANIFACQEECGSWCEGLLHIDKATTSTVSNDAKVGKLPWSTFFSLCSDCCFMGDASYIQLLCSNFGAELLMFGCHFPC